MQSSNPVLTRYAGFQPQAAPQGYGQPGPYDPSYGYNQAPGQTGYAPYGAQGAPGQAPYPLQDATGKIMTIDDVLAKAAVTMGALLAVAAATMRLMPMAWLWPATVVTGLAAFGAVALVGLRRVVNPAFVLLYAVVEGVFIGAISKVFEYLYPGIVMPAVLGTFVTAGVTLAAYKFLRVRVTGRLRQMVVIGTMALAALYFINFILSIFGINLGIVGYGPGAGMLSIVMSVVGVGLAALNLIMDFDVIESGARNQLPARESWRAAFGL
ncbi:MAG: Bax inhibitor-1/YccA family protein, partial [Propionibacteriaceae bacterium]|nr:Bax inhibitor-1/YccA family protein [Propionibacteriaceae bacterium]